MSKQFVIVGAKRMERFHSEGALLAHMDRKGVKQTGTRSGYPVFNRGIVGPFVEHGHPVRYETAAASAKYGAENPTGSLMPWLIGAGVVVVVGGGAAIAYAMSQPKTVSATVAPGLQTFHVPAGQTLAVSLPEGAKWSGTGLLYGETQLAQPGTASPGSFPVTGPMSAILSAQWTDASGASQVTAITVIPNAAVAGIGALQVRRPPLGMLFGLMPRRVAA